MFLYAKYLQSFNFHSFKQFFSRKFQKFENTHTFYILLYNLWLRLYRETFDTLKSRWKAKEFANWPKFYTRALKMSQKCMYMSHKFYTCFFTNLEKLKKFIFCVLCHNFCLRQDSEACNTLKLWYKPEKSTDKPYFYIRAL